MHIKKVHEAKKSGAFKYAYLCICTFFNCILEHKNQGTIHCVNLHFHFVNTFTFTSLHGGINESVINTLGSEQRKSDLSLHSVTGNVTLRKLLHYLTG